MKRREFLKVLAGLPFVPAFLKEEEIVASVGASPPPPENKIVETEENYNKWVNSWSLSCSCSPSYGPEDWK